MRNSDEQQTPFSLARPPAPRRRIRRLLLPGGMALALALTLGIGAFWGAAPDTSQTLAEKSNVALVSLRPTRMPTRMPATPGQCGGQLTVSGVSNRTITVTTSDGSAMTIYTTAQTRYTQYGHTVSLSAIRVGSTIYVVGTCAGQGRNITATSIEIVN